MRAASSEKPDPRSNHLFSRLDQELQASLTPHMEYVNLTVGKSFSRPGSSVEYVLLPLTCVIGVVNVSEDGAGTLLALVGAEGLVGISAFMSGRIVSNGALVCSPGIAARIPADVLQRAFSSNQRMRDVVLRYAQAFVAEMVETAHCGRRHSVMQQFSVLLLRATDKLGSRELLLTQERVADMLGVRRETVTHAAKALDTRGLLNYRRGRVLVVDRPELERTACACYEKIRRVYRSVYLED